MKEFVAVNDPLTFVKFNDGSSTPDISCLKREALIFNRIAIPNLEAFITDKEIANTYSDFARELEWLFDNRIIFEPPIIGKPPFSNDEYEQLWLCLEQYIRKIPSTVLGFNFEEMEKAKTDKTKIEEVVRKIKMMPRRVNIMASDELKNEAPLMTAYMTRILSIELRELYSVDAYPILATSISSNKKSEANKNDVVEIVLKALPVPDDETSWEQIIEYRTDPDSQNKFLDLRHWMSEVARAKLAPNEVEEKLEYLLSRYKRHIELHKIKTNASRFETIVISGGEILDDLVHFKFSNVGKALFAVRHRKIALLEGELTLPGNEVAYIIKARETFN